MEEEILGGDPKGGVEKNEENESGSQEDQDMTRLLWETTKVPLKKEIFGCFERHLSFWVSDVESPLIFLSQKKKKTHDWIFLFSLI